MTNIINILHLSDLHYTKSSFNQALVLQALLKDLAIISKGELKPDLIIFSGDLVNNADDADIYYHLYDDLIEPISKITRCSQECFILCPGNHDAQRSLINKHLESGYTTNLKSRDQLNEIFTDKACEAYVSKKFYNFHTFQDYFLQPVKSNFLYKNYSLGVNQDYSIDIACFNSAWLTSTGFQGINDKNRLLLPEAAIKCSSQLFTSANLKIAVTHHPLDWLASFNYTHSEELISKNFDVHLYGHMHIPKPQLTNSLQGTLFSNQAGALYDRRDGYNGYSIISIDLETKNIRTTIRSYYSKRDEFDIGTDFISEGICYSSPEARNFWQKRVSTILPADIKKWIQNKLLPEVEHEYNEGLSNRPICDIFVPPPMSYKNSLDDTQDTDDNLINKEKSINILSTGQFFNFL